MAKPPKADAPLRTLLSLEQFAALESWVEAMMRYSHKKPGGPHAPLVTDIYQKRMRAMELLTGAKPPTTEAVAPPEDDFDDIA